MKNFVKKNCKHIVTAAALVTMSGAAFGQHWDLGGNSISDPDTEFIGTLSDFPFRIWTAGTERMVVDQNGLVGIGTMYPTVNLDIFGEEKQQLFIRSSSADALLRLHAVGNYVDIYNPISTSGDLRFGFNGTDRVTFTSTGNVGIGETNPNSKLYVLSADDIGTTNFVQFLAANKTQGIGIGFNSINAIGSNTNQDIIISPKGTGKVGIGTNSPGSKLSVNGETSIGSSYATTAAPTNGMIVEGNTGVGMTTFPQTSKLAVNGGSGTGIYANGDDHGLYALGTDFAVEAIASGGAICVGVEGKGSASNESYGVRGSASNAANRFAIYGTAVGGTFSAAAFFNGASYTTANDWTPSDKKLKEKIQSYQVDLSILDFLEVKEYEFKKEESTSYISFPEGKQIGFIAQDLEGIFPHIVRDSKFPSNFDEDGKILSEGIEFKAVNLTDLIPILFSIVKQQQEEIRNIKAENHRFGIYANNEYSLIESRLFQNKPNPWDKSTIIEYKLGNDVKSAYLFITDLNGRLVKQLRLINNETKIELHGNEFQPGTYIYTLITDDKPIESRKMIILN